MCIGHVCNNYIYIIYVGTCVYLYMYNVYMYVCMHVCMNI